MKSLNMGLSHEQLELILEILDEFSSDKRF